MAKYQTSERFKQIKAEAEAKRKEQTGKATAAEGKYQTSERFKQIKEQVRAGGLTFGVDQSYIDSFNRDLKKFQSQYQTDFETPSWSSLSQEATKDSRISQWKDLHQRADRIRAYLNSNRASMDAKQYEDAIKNLDQTVSFGQGTVKSYTDTQRFYNSFDSQEAYDEYEHAVELSNADTDALSKELEEMRQLYDQVEGTGWYASYRMNPDVWGTEDYTEDVALFQQVDNTYGSIGGLQSAINDKQSYLQEAKAVQGYSSTYWGMDLEELGRQVGSMESDMNVRAGEMEAEAQRYANYESGLSAGKFKDYSDESLSKIQDEYLKRNATAQEAYDTARRSYNEAYDVYAYRSDLQTIENMSEQEMEAVEKLATGIFTGDAEQYLLAQGYSEDEIERLAETYKRHENQKKYEEMVDKAKAFAGQNLLTGSLGTLSTYPARFVGSITSGLETLGQKAAYDLGISNYGTMDPYAAGYRPSGYSSAVREQVASDIEAGFTGKVGGMAYNALNSAVDSALRLIAGPRGAKIVAAAGALGDGAQQATLGGASADEAFLLGVASAGLEALTEHYSIENLMKITSATDGASFVKNMAKQGFIEATEEEASFWGGLAAEAVILGENSDFNKRVQELVGTGLSEAEAKKKAYKELFSEATEIAITSAMSGAIMAGGSQALQMKAKNTTKQNIVPSGVDTESINQYDSLINKQGGTENAGSGQVDYGGVQRNQEVYSERKVAGSTENGRGNVQSSAQRRVYQGSRSEGIYSSDNEGRKVTTEQVQKLQNTAIVNEEGAPIAVYHSTDNMEFDTFARGDIGFHFGTQDQAIKRSTDKNSNQGRMFRAYLNIKNPLQADTDIMGWKANGTSLYLWTKGILSDAEYQEVQSLLPNGADYDSPASVKLREILENKGYDGIAYPNGFEGQGNSYIVFQDKQIIRSEITEYSGRQDSMRQPDVMSVAVGRKKVVNKDNLSTVNRLSSVDVQGVAKARSNGTSAISSGQTDRVLVANSRKRGYVKGYDIKIAKLNEAFNSSQKQAYKILDTIAAATGIDVVLYQSHVNPRGELRGKVVEGIDLTNDSGAFSWHNDKIYIDINAGLLYGTELEDVAKYSMLRTFTHEFTHFLEKHDPDGYNELRTLVFDTMRQNGYDPDAMVEEYMEQEDGLTKEKAGREVVAESMTDILPQTRFVQELAEKHRNVFEKLLDKFKSFVEEIKAHFARMAKNTAAEAEAVKICVGGTLQYAEDLVKLFDRVAVRAVESYQATMAKRNTDTDSDGVQYQIKQIGGTGKYYVQADRQVLTGSDPASWGKQIERYINETIRKEQDIAIPTADGHILLLTGRSSYKLSDQHIASIQNKIVGILSDADFALKGRAATHIDELIQVARFSRYRPDLNQKHENDIGEDGFNYFKAYFHDFDGKYYEVMFSAGINAQEETTYSIGSIRQRSFPADTGSSSKTEALKNGRKASDNIIYTSSAKSQEIKSAVQLAYEKALAKKTEKSQEQHQRRRASLSDRDILEIASKQNMTEGFSDGEKYALKTVNEVQTELKDLTAKKAEQESILERLEKAGKGRSLEAAQARNRAKIFANNVKEVTAKLERYETAPVVRGIVDKVRPGVEKQMIEARKKELAKYGTIPKGEKAVRESNLPTTTDGKNKVSRTARTVYEARVTPDDFAELIDREVYLKDGMTYLPITNNETTRKATEWVERLGWTAALAEWHKDVGRGKTGADIVARGAILLNNAAQSGDKANWLEILFSYQQLGTKTAQGLQALRILKALAPNDKLHMIRRSVEQMVADMHLKTQIQIDKELLKRFKMADSDEVRDLILGQIQQNVADQLPASFIDKFTALRYLNMLGNPRTQVRNFFGNAMMKMVAGIKNTIAASLESIVYYGSGKKFQRTRSVLVDKGLLKAAKADYENIKPLLLDGGKYSKEKAESSEFAKQVMEKRRIFKSKFLEKYRAITNDVMDQGDLIFSKAAYSRALAGYLQAKGVTNIAKADEIMLDEARVFAVKEAQEQTFRDTNWLSGWISKIGRRHDTPKIGYILGDGVMPFRKTPANILIRAEEYSPLGIINSVVTSIRAMGKNSAVTGDQVINSWAKSLTGTGLFGLGMLLSSLGLLKGGPDDDDELDKFESLYGEQNYAITLPDGTNFTFDWASPAAIPMLMGAQFMELITEDGFQLSDLEHALTSLLEPMVELSSLQGIKDTLDNVQFAENNLGQMVIIAGLNYLTQGMTNSWLGQVERTFQDSRQMTYVDKDSAIPAWMQRAMGTALSKVPGIDYNQIPYINAWGEEEENPNVGLNAVYNMISPSYFDKSEKDAVYDELVRLNDVQDENVFPKTPEMTITYTDKSGNEHEDYGLSAEEYVELAKTQGQKQRKLVESLIDNKEYEKLPDEYKAKAIWFAYKYAKEYARIEVLDAEGYSDKWMQEIKGDVAAAIIQHVKDQK